MITSRDRILTTHVGSLPRNETLTDLLVRREAGAAIDPKQLAAEMDRAVAEVVKQQKDAGIDIGNDGEQQRVGFQTYMAARMTGFGGESKRRTAKDLAAHPDQFATFARRFPHGAKQRNAPQAIAAVKYVDLQPIKDEIARFKRSAAGAFVEMFMTAPSPGIVATTLLNAHYDSHATYVDALAQEIAKEYRAIHEAGLILQVDAPDLAMERVMMFQDESDEAFVKAAEMHLAAINKACAGIPRDRWRLHVCWGNYEGPHTYDIALAKVLPVFYQANTAALSIEFANPRHQHEYAAFRQHPLPQDMVLIPGVIETTSNIVEHPEVVARRIEEAVAAVGDRERVIASTDCGFGTFAGREWVAPSVVWAKLATLRAGADLASQRLWGRKVA
ncbi:MAG TPA: cobalamin-independent methionine synthase II family protein [Xanthobacteraceae bacterium]|nr:cobalamin-independent methionine synthase II family protein [Xanthobacteraceae bacterium]